MITLLFVVSACAPPALTDRTGLGFDDTLGRTTLARATAVCRERYHGCLVRLERVTPTDFRAVCRRAS